MSDGLGPLSPNQHAPGGKPFPDVHEDQIEAAGNKVSAAAESLVAARRQVHSAAVSTAWTSPSARPAWDAALDARESDVSVGHAVLSDIGDTMVTAAGYLRELRGTYNQAVFYLATNPDPSVSQDAGGGMGSLATPIAKPDPKAVAEYEAVKRLRDNTATEARSVLDALGTQFSHASAVTFATPPTTPVNAVTPAGLVVPIVPAFGAPTGALFANGMPFQFPRGVNFEKGVLNDLGVSGLPKRFYRPPDDANLPANYPRTRILGKPRGSFPDSDKADVLEIKSGISKVSVRDPQIQAELELAKRTGRPFNLIVEEQTEVSKADIRTINTQTGGSVYEQVPGQTNVYRDRLTGDLVHLQGAQGPDHDQLGRTPLTPDETRRVEEALRSNNAPPQSSAPPSQADPYVTQQQLDNAYADNPDAEPPAPGVVPEDPAGPAEPVDPELPEFPFEGLIE